MKLTLIGAPTGVGANITGRRLRLGTLRVVGIGKALRAFGMDVHDAGDITGPPNPQSPSANGYRHLPEVIEWDRAVRDAVAAELTDGRISVLVDGDHSLAVGSISAIAAHCRRADKKLRIIWVDTHADINTSELTPPGNIHGMPMTCLLGDGPGELTSMSSRKPTVEVDNIRQIGLRSVDLGEKRVLVDRGLEVFDMRFLDRTSMRHAMKRALHDTDEGIRIHLSLDLDFADPQVAPGVGTPIVGGLTYREAQLAMEMIADTERLGSMDLVEINPALDTRNTIAELAVDLIEGLFGKSTPLRFTEA